MFIWKDEYERLLSRIEDLQEENAGLYEEIAELRHKLALASNAHFVEESKKYIANYNEVCRKCGTLEGQVNALQTENTYLKSTIKMYQESLKPEQILRRDTSGKFESDMTKDEKCELVVQMREAGMKDEEIAAELGIKYDTVRKYAALHEKNSADDDVLVSPDGGKRVGRWVKRSEIENGVWIYDPNYKIIEKQPDKIVQMRPTAP